MCDPEGVYIFKSGIEYRGQLKTCSRLSQSKFGIFEGSATLKIPGLGVFEGYFKNNLVHGQGMFEFTDGSESIESTWSKCKIDDLVNHLKASKK